MQIAAIVSPLPADVNRTDLVARRTADAVDEFICRARDKRCDRNGALTTHDREPSRLSLEQAIECSEIFVGA
jgi:hypothetical protein